MYILSVQTTESTLTILHIFEIYFNQIPTSIQYYTKQSYQVLI